MAEFIALLITLGIFVGLHVWIVWAIISRTKKTKYAKKKQSQLSNGQNVRATLYQKDLTYFYLMLELYAAFCVN